MAGFSPRGWWVFKEDGDAAVASKAASKVSWPKPVFLMEILASTSASRKTGPSPPPATSPAPEDDGVKDSAAAADPRPERDVRIPKLFAIKDGGAASMAGFSPRGCIYRIGLSSQAFKTDQIQYMTSSTASFRRRFSSGGAPPRSSSDDGVKDSTVEDSFAAALDFSDGEEVKSDHDSSDHDKDVCPYRFRSPGFIVRLPHGAVWRVRDYPDSLKMKVAVPGMGKEIVMDMYWEDDYRDKIFDSDLENDWLFWVKDYDYPDELTIVIWKTDEYLEINEYLVTKYLETDKPPAAPAPCQGSRDWFPRRQGPSISFPGETYEKEQIEGNVKNGVVILTLPKIPKDEDEDDDE